MQEPKNRELEHVVLAGMMNDSECYYESISDITGDYFTTDEAQYIFNELQQDKRSANVLLKSTPEPKKKSAIQTIDGAWTNKGDFDKALNSLKQIYKKRQLYYTINTLTSRFDNQNNEELLDYLHRQVSEFEYDDSGRNILKPGELAPELLGRFYEKVNDPNKLTGISYTYENNRGVEFGFPSLNQAFNGAVGGDLIMIAGKTGHGKTGLAIQLARQFSLFQDYKGYYMNSEMNEDELIARLLAPIAKVKANEIYYGRLEGQSSEHENKISSIREAYDVYMKSNLIVSDIPDLTLNKVIGLSKQLKNAEGLDYLIIDYIGRMTMNYNMNLWDELYEITKALKKLAKQLQIPIFVLAQRNHDGEIEGAKKMKNETDGTLMFEPITDKDKEYIRDNIRQDDWEKVNYRLVKSKVRRDDNPAPIYCVYDKARNHIREAKSNAI